MDTSYLLKDGKRYPAVTLHDGTRTLHVFPYAAHQSAAKPTAPKRRQPIVSEWTLAAIVAAALLSLAGMIGHG